jgi:predicted nucleic acid-binding protein
MNTLVLDTNVVIDILTKREGYKGSLDILRLCERGAARGYITTSTATDILYLTTKILGKQPARDALKSLLESVDIIEVKKADIMGAFNHDMDDFKDAVLANCAARIKADFIVTRNLKDFRGSAVKAVAPEEVRE